VWDVDESTRLECTDKYDFILEYGEQGKMKEMNFRNFSISEFITRLTSFTGKLLRSTFRW
jgi:hypothetical protein